MSASVMFLSPGCGVWYGHVLEAYQWLIEHGVTLQRAGAWFKGHLRVPVCSATKGRPDGGGAWTLSPLLSRLDCFFKIKHRAVGVTGDMI